MIKNEEWESERRAKLGAEQAHTVAELNAIVGPASAIADKTSDSLAAHTPQAPRHAPVAIAADGGLRPSFHTRRAGGGAGDPHGMCTQQCTGRKVLSRRIASYCTALGIWQGTAGKNAARSSCTHNPAILPARDRRLILSHAPRSPHDNTISQCGQPPQFDGQDEGHSSLS